MVAPKTGPGFYPQAIVHLTRQLEEAKQEISDLKFQRDVLEKATKGWMKEYNELREKYEPTTLGFTE